jgi:Amt family ammonium transporter
MQKSTADIFWVLMTGGLVFTMQGGFLCLESGLTRTKNSINVALKNLSDFAVAAILFWLFGFAMMFGSTWGGWIGTSLFAPDLDAKAAWLSTFFFFQVMFCATAATIVSGSVAERMRFTAYMIETAVISGLIYPLFGHWAWGGAFAGEKGWLAAKGFVDFAGSSVVHSVGGWVSLAALLIIGPRTGRFPKDGPPEKIYSSSLPFSMLGVVLLFFGWFGFNGGSTLAADDRVPGILINTFMGGSSGLVTGMFLGYALSKRPDAGMIINGSLAGLVSVTANCHATSALAAIVIGAVGAVITIFVDRLLLRFQIDDAVSAVAVHAGSGVWGTLAVALFGQPDLLGTGLGRWDQLQIQAFGILVCFATAFGLAYVCLRVINRVQPLRVTSDDEQSGLNVSEHGEKSDLIDLLTVMEAQARSGDLKERVPVEPFTEVGQIAQQYNRVIDALEKALGRYEERTLELARSNSDLQQFAYVASHDLQEPLRIVSSYAQLFEQRYKTQVDEKGQKWIFYMVDASKRMQRLIEDLLTYSRVGTKGKEPSRVDSRKCVQDALANLRLAIERNGAEVTHDAMPPVVADSLQLTQLFQNLVGNSLKYRDEQAPRVHIAARRDGTQCQFSVRDNGIGIDPRFHERIFGLFQRLHERGKYEGTGIGLAICKKIVERHGGTIWVDSNQDKGTTFHFTLPLAEQ